MDPNSQMRESDTLRILHTSSLTRSSASVLPAWQPASATLKIDNSHLGSRSNHMAAKQSISEDGLVMSTATRELRDYCTPHPNCGGEE